eukprot:gene9762-11400_t
MNPTHSSHLALITELDLTGCKVSFVQDLMVPLARHCTELSRLLLINTDIKHVGPSVTFQRLNYLGLDNCEQLESIQIASLVRFEIAAFNCPQLLTIKACPTLYLIRATKVKGTESLCLSLLIAPNME